MPCPFWAENFKIWAGGHRNAPPPAQKGQNKGHTRELILLREFVNNMCASFLGVVTCFGCMMSGALTVKTGFTCSSIQLEDEATFSWHYLMCTFVFVVFACIHWYALYLADIGMQIVFHFTYKDKKGTYSTDNIEKTKHAIFRAFYECNPWFRLVPLCELFQLFWCCSSAKGHMSLMSLLSPVTLSTEILCKLP